MTTKGYALIDSVTGKVPSAQVSTPSLGIVGSPTYSTVDDWFNCVQSSGVISGGVVSDAGSGKIAVTGGTGVIKSSNSYTGTSLFFDFVAPADISITANVKTYVYVDYNSGSPVVSTTTSYSTINHNDHVYLGKVYNDGSKVHVASTPQWMVNLASVLSGRLIEAGGEFYRASGFVISEPGAPSKKVATSDGVYYSGLNRKTVTGIDTSGAGRFTYWYRNTPASPPWVPSDGWISVASQTTINNTQYDDGTGTLATLTNDGAHYGVHWVYSAPDGDVHIIYGQGNYTEAAASASTAPADIPPVIAALGLFIGRITIKESDSTFSEIAQPWESVLNTTGATNHNGLSGLQGGGPGEYYHLTQNEHLRITDGVVDVNAATYNMTNADSAFQVRRTLSGTCDIYLLSIAAIGRRVIDITDSGDNCGVYNIIVHRNGSDKMGFVSADITMDVSGSTLSLRSNPDTSNWEII